MPYNVIKNKFRFYLLILVCITLMGNNLSYDFPAILCKNNLLKL